MGKPTQDASRTLRHGPRPIHQSKPGANLSPPKPRGQAGGLKSSGAELGGKEDTGPSKTSWTAELHILRARAAGEATKEEPSTSQSTKLGSPSVSVPTTKGKKGWVRTACFGAGVTPLSTDTAAASWTLVGHWPVSYERHRLDVTSKALCALTRTFCHVSHFTDENCGQCKGHFTNVLSRGSSIHQLGLCPSLPLQTRTVSST